MREGFVEHRLVDLATRQHGVVARRQLLALGLRSAAIGRRVRAGRLHAVHAGVYAVGHTILDARGRWMAAVLACGRGAALGYASAAALWGLRRSDSGLIDVVVPVAGGRRRPGIRVHRHPGLAAHEVASCDAIPVTTAARTILDLAATVSDRALEHALDRAEILELVDYAALDALARARRHHRGSARLRATLQRHLAGTARTRSELEVAFRALCERFGFPPALVNEPVCGITGDFLFAEQRIAVETDSWEWHRGRAAFERDRERDALLAAAAYRTLRFTDRQITRAEATVARALRAALTPNGTAARTPRTPPDPGTQ